MRFPVTRFQNLQPDQPPASQPIRGAGDLVARFAKPVARALDRVIGTRLQDCTSCDARQQWLNRFFGFWF